MNLRSIKLRLDARNRSSRAGITLQVAEIEEMVELIERQHLVIEWAKETLRMMVSEGIIEYVDLSRLDAERRG